MHRGKTTVGKNETGTETRPRVSRERFSLFILLMLSSYYIQPSPDSWDWVDCSSTSMKRMRNEFGSRRGTRDEQIGWSRLRLMTSLVWCPAWQLKAQIWWSHVFKVGCWVGLSNGKWVKCLYFTVAIHHHKTYCGCPVQAVRQKAASPRYSAGDRCFTSAGRRKSQ